MSNLPATNEKPKPLSLRERIENAAPEFARALPGHVPVERFVRQVQTAITMQPDIVRIAEASPGAMQSLMTACTNAAKDGLILDGREAALTPFNVKVEKNPDRWEERIQYIPMVAGLMKMARNSGEISNITAHVVHENDAFRYILGDDERIEHAPLMGGDRGAPTAVYAIVKMKDGTVQREVMDRAAVMRIAAQSKNGYQYDPEKGKNYGEWWRKTVIRRISKYLPRSSDKDDFLRAVERIDGDFDYAEEAKPSRPAGKARGGAAAALRNITPAPTTAPAQDAQEAERETIDAETGEVFDVIDPEPDII